MCEAASGFYATAAEAPRVSPTRRQALARLGFSSDGSHGNFQHFFRIRSAAEYAGIADMLLTALYEGYDVRIRDAIDVEAPFALLRRGTPWRDRCTPVS